MLGKELVLGFHTHAVATWTSAEAEKVRLAFKPVRKLYGETPAAKFGPASFKAVRQQTIDEGLCITTNRSRMGTVRRMVAWAVENEHGTG